MDAARLSADAARITNFSGRADAYRWTEERDGHAVGQQQAERHRASAGWRDALWRMGSCHLPASAGRGVWVPEGGVCGPRDPSSESPARRLRTIDFADRATPRFTNCPHSKARCNQKEGQMPKVRLYGTFTEVRSTFSMPLKLTRPRNTREKCDVSSCMGKSLTWGSHSSGTRRPLNAN